MSLPAMLLGETVNEIVQASQVTRDIVDALAPKKSRKSTMPEEEGCPTTQQKSLEPKPKTVNSNIKARRKKEKQNKRSEPTSPASIHKARQELCSRLSLHRQNQRRRLNMVRIVLGIWLIGFTKAQTLAQQKRRFFSPTLCLYPVHLHNKLSSVELCLLS
uniref:Uncharacterized protein n=1 Tax=Brassica oleracea TaxID=3712 RepID=A0A3P6FK64_BRAOL|nr:unnamed protein product [Brassica oleracea]